MFCYREFCTVKAGMERLGRHSRVKARKIVNEKKFSTSHSVTQDSPATLSALMDDGAPSEIIHWLPFFRLIRLSTNRCNEIVKTPRPLSTTISCPVGPGFTIQGAFSPLLLILSRGLIVQSQSETIFHHTTRASRRIRGGKGSWSKVMMSVRELARGALWSGDPCQLGRPMIA